MSNLAAKKSAYCVPLSQAGGIRHEACQDKASQEIKLATFCNPSASTNLDVKGGRYNLCNSPYCPSD